MSVSKLRVSVVALLIAALMPVHLFAAPGTRADTTKKGLPLQQARTARFTTTTGTWISLDVSPDGQTLVFDLLGDLYTMPVSGGQATPLTRGLAHDMQPRYSPDGKWIVFVSDRSGDENVWLLSADGRDTVQLTTGEDNSYLSPDFTPDGNYVVVSKSTLFGLEKLWLYHVKGGRGLELTPGPGGLKINGLTMGPDERYIWYAFRSGPWQYNAVFPQYQLGIYDRETGTRTTMSSRFGSAFRPAISRAGQQPHLYRRHT